MKDLETKIVELLKETPEISSADLGASNTEIHAALLSLASKETVEYSITTSNRIALTEAGNEVVRNGSPEYLLMMKLRKNGVINDQDKTGMKYAFKNKWIRQESGGIQPICDGVEDRTRKSLLDPKTLTTEEDREMKKRGLIESVKQNQYKIRRGRMYGIERASQQVELTTENLNTDVSLFKPYNFETVGLLPIPGSLHPLTKIRKEIKGIFLEMGFSEMNTARYVESSFWNFDALFQPQDHPSRECHDTFFIEEPAYDDLVDVDSNHLKLVISEHSGEEAVSENGEIRDPKSLGHRSSFDVSEAKKNILRTHTTAISTRMLYELSRTYQKDRPFNAKLFSIDKVFRNETVDATHLAEFHQVEGVVAGRNQGLRELIHVLETFFRKLGMERIKFKPAFNPYTEPSMEVFGYHDGLGKWIEVGNSGIFRPEMLRPMGFDDDVTVIAWGLSLERPSMIKYRLDNIRELLGHKVDVNFIRESPVIFMDK
ncbi:SYFA [Enterospora canceri]|uniref:phenylalanine--tRNA ligase n=1 Tax=Enterospora canceri TaxID=1081671 RepID=A0A1Y1SAB3_9MICR|nr:SYFA [Enterospora canceri]